MPATTHPWLPALLLLALPGWPLAALTVELERITDTPFAIGDSGNGRTEVLAITPDGASVLVATEATQLMPGISDTNGNEDYLVYDRAAGSFDWITISAADPQRSANTDTNYVPIGDLSDDGRYVVYQSCGTGHVAGADQVYCQVYLFDRVTRGTTLVSHAAANPAQPANGASTLAALSADGRFVVYESTATDLVTGVSDANGGHDVFLFDRESGASSLISARFDAAATTGSAASRVGRTTPDGRFVLLTSDASNLVPSFVDGNGSGTDLYLWDRDQPGLVLVSHESGAPAHGANRSSGNGHLAADGSRVAFSSFATNLVANFDDNNGNLIADAFHFERATGINQLVAGISAIATSNGGTSPLPLSQDGRYAFFSSPSTNVIAGLVRPPDATRGLFRRDTAGSEIRLVNHRAGQPNAIAAGGLESVVVAADGELVAFSNSGTDIVAGQSAGEYVLIAYDLPAGQPRLISHLPGQPASGAHGRAKFFTADQRRLVLESSDDLVAVGTDLGRQDAFLYDLDQSATTRLSSAAVAGLAGGFSQPWEVSALPAAGLFLFHVRDVSRLLPGISDPNIESTGFDPLLVDPRTGALTALVAPGNTTPDGDSWATFLADGINFLLRTTAVAVTPGIVDGNGGSDLYLGNRTTGALQLLSSAAGIEQTTANGRIGINLAASANGRFVVHGTTATNALAGITDGNGAEDVVLLDRQLGTRTLVSHAAGEPATAGDRTSFPIAMSDDGELLLFASYAGNLIAGYVDNNGADDPDLFLFRRSTGAIVLVNHRALLPNESGFLGVSSAHFSGDGRFVLFSSSDSSLVTGMTDTNGEASDVFLYTVATGEVSLISHRPGEPLVAGNGESSGRRITPDGRYVVVSSQATDLVTGMTGLPNAYNLFLYDRQSGSVQLVNHVAGEPLHGSGSASFTFTLSADGRYLGFYSTATDLVPGQTPPPFDDGPYNNAYLLDRGTETIALISRGLAGPTESGNQSTLFFAFDPQTMRAAFVSEASNLSTHDAGRSGSFDLFVADLTGGGLIFRDGFETGDTSLWSATLGFAGAATVDGH